jgi:diguanylate cyclase (GGDEF)-like protein
MPVLKENISFKKEKAKRAAELVIANKELAFQTKEKAKRAAELVIANKELAFQTKEKAKRAVEIIDLVASNKELHNFSLCDPLTQLANRRFLSDRIEHIQATDRRSKQKSALLFVDLDHFKLVNDRLGHAYGDLLLQQVAERLEVCTRKGDVVARIGGDEFVVLLEALGDDLAEATIATKKFSKKLFALLDKPYQLNEHVWKSTASVGVALFSGNKLTPDELLKQADVAMYHAKLTEGNAMQYFERASSKNKKLP